MSGGNIIPESCGCDIPSSHRIEDVPMPDAVALPPPPVKDAASGDVEMKDVSKSTLNVGHDKDKPASKSTKVGSAF